MYTNNEMTLVKAIKKVAEKNPKYCRADVFKYLFEVGVPANELELLNLDYDKETAYDELHTLFKFFAKEETGLEDGLPILIIHAFKQYKFDTKIQELNESGMLSDGQLEVLKSLFSRIVKSLNDLERSIKSTKAIEERVEADPINNNIRLGEHNDIDLGKMLPTSSQDFQTEIDGEFEHIVACLNLGMPVSEAQDTLSKSQDCEDLYARLIGDLDLNDIFDAEAVAGLAIVETNAEKKQVLIKALGKFRPNLILTDNILLAKISPNEEAGLEMVSGNLFPAFISAMRSVAIEQQYSSHITLLRLLDSLDILSNVVGSDLTEVSDCVNKLADENKDGIRTYLDSLASNIKRDIEFGVTNHVGYQAILPFRSQGSDFESESGLSTLARTAYIYDANQPLGSEKLFPGKPDPGSAPLL